MTSFDAALYEAASRDAQQLREAYLAAIATNGHWNESLLEPLRKALCQAMALRDMARGEQEDGAGPP